MSSYKTIECNTFEEAYIIAHKYINPTNIPFTYGNRGAYYNSVIDGFTPDLINPTNINEGPWSMTEDALINTLNLIFTLNYVTHLLCIKDNETTFLQINPNLKRPIIDFNNCNGTSPSNGEEKSIVGCYYRYRTGHFKNDQLFEDLFNSIKTKIYFASEQLTNRVEELPNCILVFNYDDTHLIRKDYQYPFTIPQHFLTTEEAKFKPYSKTYLDEILKTPHLFKTQSIEPKWERGRLPKDDPSENPQGNRNNGRDAYSKTYPIGNMWERGRLPKDDSSGNPQGNRNNGRDAYSKTHSIGNMWGRVRLQQDDSSGNPLGNRNRESQVNPRNTESQIGKWVQGERNTTYRGGAPNSPQESPKLTYELEDSSILPQELEEPPIIQDDKYIEPIQWGIKKKYLPVIGFSGHEDYFDIASVGYEEYEYVTKLEGKLKELATYKWDEKINKAVFRGGMTGCGISDSTNIRLRLAKLSQLLKDSDDIINAAIIPTDITYGSRAPAIHYKNEDIVFGLKNPIYDKDRQEVYKCIPDHSKYRIEDGLTYTEQSRYKYIIHADGYVAAGRLLKSIMSKSLTLKINSPTNLWFLHILENNKHFKTIREDLDDLKSTVDYCISNDTEAREIAQNGYDLVSKFMNKKCLINIMNYIFWEISDKVNINDRDITSASLSHKYLKYKNKYINLKNSNKYLN